MYRGNANGEDLSAQYINDNIAVLDKLPVDGLTFTIGYYKYAYAFDARRVATWNDLNPTLLSSVNWGHFTDNFLLLWASASDYAAPDWYNDNAWNIVAANAGLFARAAKVSGAKGIMFDPEPYAPSISNPWLYSSSKYGGRSYEEVKSEVRKRGAQWMTAVQNEYPDITLYTTFLASLSMTWYQNDASKLPTDTYGLLPAFEDGMLDALGPNARIIDGNEIGYFYSDTETFYQRSDSTKNPAPGWIAPENLAKYKNQVEYSNGVYVDGILSEGSFTSSYRSSWWRHNLYHALATADEYVWLFDQGVDLTQPGTARDDFLAAKNKYLSGQALGFEMHNPDGTGQITYPCIQARIMTSPAITTTPAGGSTRFKAPASVTLTSAITGGTVSKIEFWVNGVYKGEIYGSSRQWTLNNVQPGNYEIVARVFDSQNNYGSSAPVRFIVDP